MSEIRFTVPAVPVPQPRARATAVNGHARMYEAGKEHAIHTFKSGVRMAARQVYSGAPLDGPLGVTMVFVFPRPASMRWKKRAMPRTWHRASRGGDVDNLAKGVLDALNGLCFVDDCQVAEAHVTKYIAAGDEPPHVEVCIQPLEE